MSTLARITPAQFAALDGMVETGKLLADFGMTYRMNSAGLIRWNADDVAWEITDYGTMAHAEYEAVNPKTEVDMELLDLLIALVQLEEDQADADEDEVIDAELVEESVPLLPLPRLALAPATEPAKKPRHRGRRATRAKAIA